MHSAITRKKKVIKSCAMLLTNKLRSATLYHERR
nr:MAG TPA: hypothetical protein [Caudoviricetes sp.]DAS48342.1 MAG TPA: hypothetical protein [Caudoviricetes sp.]